MMIKLPLDTLKMTSSVLSNLHHGKQFLNTKDTPPVLATDWQIRGGVVLACLHQLSAPQTSDKFLFQAEEVTTYPTHLKRAVRRMHIGSQGCAGREKGPLAESVKLHDQPSSLCGCTVFLPFSPPYY